MGASGSAEVDARFVLAAADRAVRSEAVPATGRSPYELALVVCLTALAALVVVAR